MLPLSKKALTLVSRANQKAGDHGQAQLDHVNFNSIFLIEIMLEHNRTSICDAIKQCVGLKEYRHICKTIMLVDDYEVVLSKANEIANKEGCRIINDVHLVLATLESSCTAMSIWNTLDYDKIASLKNTLRKISSDIKNTLEHSACEDEQDSPYTTMVNLILDVLQENLKQRLADNDAIAQIRVIVKDK